MAPPLDLSIRPMSVGAMIDRAVAVALRHFRPLFVAMLLVQAPGLLLLRLTSERTGALWPLLGDPAALAARAAGLGGLLAVAAGGLVLLQFAATAAAAAIVTPSLAGRHASPAPRLAARARSTAGAAVLQLALLALAPALGALPGLWLASRATSSTSALLGLAGALVGALLLLLLAVLRTLLAPAVAAVEGAAPIAALRRASRLMAPRPGQPVLERPGVRASLLLLTSFLLALAVNGLASLPRLALGRLTGAGPLPFLPGALPVGLEVGLALFEACAGAALQPFSLTAVAVLYFERRARREGLDLEAWAASLEGPG